LFFFRDCFALPQSADEGRVGVAVEVSCEIEEKEKAFIYNPHCSAKLPLKADLVLKKYLN
jgi:hypothetical protein